MIHRRQVSKGMGAAKWLSKWLHVEHGTLSIFEARALAPPWD